MVYEQLTIMDKRGNEYTLVCTLDRTDASLTVLNQTRKKKNPGFSWKGTVNAFFHAVQEMLKRLGKRG